MSAKTDVSGVKLRIGPRPKLSAIDHFVSEGVTDVLTLLQPHERPEPIGTAVTRNGLKWHWHPCSASLLSGESALPSRIIYIAARVWELVAEGSVLYLHCAAGLHRTGMVVYAMLRIAGLDQWDALDIIRELRPATADALEKDLERLDLIDEELESKPKDEDGFICLA